MPLARAAALTERVWPRENGVAGHGNVCLQTRIWTDWLSVLFHFNSHFKPTQQGYLLPQNKIGAAPNWVGLFFWVPVFRLVKWLRDNEGTKIQEPPNCSFPFLFSLSTHPERGSTQQGMPTFPRNALLKQTPSLLSKSFLPMLQLMPSCLDFDNKRAHFRQRGWFHGFLSGFLLVEPHPQKEVVVFLLPGFRWCLCLFLIIFCRGLHHTESFATVPRVGKKGGSPLAEAQSWLSF